MLNAAASIEAAAKKLADLRPRKEAVSFVGEGVGIGRKGIGEGGRGGGGVAEREAGCWNR